MTTDFTLEQMGKKAKAAVQQMAQAGTDQKNQALKQIAERLEFEKSEVLRENLKDLKIAESRGMNPAMLDRLSLQGRLEGIIHDIRQVASLPDPVGEIYENTVLSNGLQLCKCRTPIGVMGVIYEARPNVTVDVSCMTLKTGNCVILRGGSETLQTNRAIVKVIQDAVFKVGLPENSVQLICNPDRSQVKEMLQMHESIDLIIPRGGAKLHAFCKENSRIPVISGGIGICHLYVDETANLEASLEVIHNAKTRRPSVCNALDTLLVHESIAKNFLPNVISKLGKSQVSFRLDENAMQVMSRDMSNCSLAGPEDWDTEWLDLILGIKVVKNLMEAVKHIQKHSSGHSDGILTENEAHASEFLKLIDSAAVYVNASTCFTDGGQFGLGAEVAISTQKVHARGPMGLRELTSYKWIVKGNYQVRE